MNTRQTVQPIYPSMLYIGLLLFALLPALAVMVLVVIPEREAQKQELMDVRETVEAQSTVIVQSQATATAITEAYDTVINYSHWPPFFYDTFNTNENAWGTGQRKADILIKSTPEFNGKYKWITSSKDETTFWSYSDIEPVSDFYLTVEGQQISGTESGYHGVTFRRDDDNNYYLFTVRDGQRFRFALWYQEKLTTLIDWTTTPAIRPDSVNRLTVIGEGSHFLFYINNQLVAEADDSRLSRGQVGLASGLLNAADEAVFEFDNFEVRAP